ncbi:hypothetical protein D5R40_26820 [Okeania hirsuta]|uniref:Uncharacterized protein n=1 Tax=Okeania hirsuta TaxID=1458930 RepID=A0A3N6Q8V3_9CYAN|nr:hypothetical protein [Okeania hirsuta]RQH27636.1 hypothetical protein D5R40_26820 [Okeania hirsuta]
MDQEPLYAGFVSYLLALIWMPLALPKAADQFSICGILSDRGYIGSSTCSLFYASILRFLLRFKLLFLLWWEP